MKIALIGLGRWGQILSKELERLTEVKYRCDSKSDLNQAFMDHEIQAVFIATPTETHFEIASKALDAGKHVFLEKPGTTTSADLEKLVKKAEEKNLVLAVDYEFVHHPALKKLGKLTATDKIEHVELEWQKWGTFKDDAAHHLLCHDVSILKELRFTHLSISSFKQLKVISDTDVISASFKGAHSLINRISPIKQKTVTVRTSNAVYVWSNDELFKINHSARSLEKIELEAKTAVSESIKDFLESIENKHEPKTSGRFALDVFRIIEKARS